MFKRRLSPNPIRHDPLHPARKNLDQQAKRPVNRGRILKDPSYVGLQQHDICSLAVGSVVLPLNGIREIIPGSHFIGCILIHNIDIRFVCVPLKVNHS